MPVLPRPSTTHRILTTPTIAHRVALEASWSIVSACCAAAERDLQAALGWISAGREFLSQDTVGLVARLTRRATWAAWDEARDCPHPASRDRFCLSDGVPEGCADVCRAAALVCCAVAGLVEPTDEHAAIIEVWWRDTCQRARATVSVDLGELDLSRPRHALGPMIESLPRWPGTATPFVVSLDEIASEIIRGR